MIPGDPLRPFRPGLWFAFFNALTWQVAIGTPMVLLAERLGATPLQVGLLYSFVFLLTPIQILSTSLLPRYGFKRVMLAGWGARSIFLLGPLYLCLLAPAEGEAWMVHLFVASVFLFCLFRSIGGSANVPWLYAILPPSSRGRYFGSDQVYAGIGGAGTLLACASVSAIYPEYTSYFIQYSIALVGAVLSFVALSRLRDARPSSPIPLRGLIKRVPAHLTEAGPYRRFLLLSIGFAVITSSIPPFAAFYLKSEAGLGVDRILVLTTIQYAGVIAGSFLLRRWIDGSGSKPFFAGSLALYAGAALVWVGFLVSGGGAFWVLPAVYLVVGLAAAFWISAMLNYLPKIMDEGDRPVKVALHGASTSVCGGIAPILWGVFLGGSMDSAIDPVRLAIFFTCVAVASVVLLAAGLRNLPEADERGEPIHFGGATLRPVRGFSYLATLVGLGEKAEPANRAIGSAGERSGLDGRRPGGHAGSSDD